jgi:hypothetical protein
LRVLVRDENGQPVAGFAVKFTPSLDGVVSPASTVTDAEGQAQAMLRLASAEGVALADAEAASSLVIFNARIT